MRLARPLACSRQARSVLTRSALLTAALLLTLGASELEAQGLRYTQTTRMEMGGGMAPLMSMAGGMEGLGEETTTTVWVDGTHTREDHDDTSTITDWRTGEVILLDHGARTYRSLPWQEIVEDAAAAGEAELEQIPEESRPDLGMRFRLEPTGERATINGYEAEQVVLVMQMDALMPPGGPGGAAGLTTAMVTELWVSETFPAWELMTEARQAMDAAWSAEAITRALGALGPEMAEGLREQQEAMRDLRGTPLRVVTSMVQLAGGAELDVDAVLETETLESEAGGASAQELMRRRMAQIMGGPSEDTEPFIMLRTHTQIGEVEETALDPALFQVPEGYAEASGLPGIE